MGAIVWKIMYIFLKEMRFLSTLINFYDSFEVPYF